MHDTDDDTEGLIADLRARFDDARAEIDRQVAEHPFATLGLALACGAVLAMGPRRHHDEDTKRTIGSMIVAGLGALAIRGAKAYVWSRLSGTARELFAPSTSERAASRDPSVEAFLEH